jgi:hypothetical protein
MNTFFDGCDTASKQSLGSTVSEPAIANKRRLESEQQLLKLVLPAAYKLVKLDDGASIRSESTNPMVAAVRQQQPRKCCCTV